MCVIRLEANGISDHVTVYGFKIFRPPIPYVAFEDCHARTKANKKRKLVVFMFYWTYVELSIFHITGILFIGKPLFPRYAR